MNEPIPPDRGLFTLDMIEGARLGDPEPMKPPAHLGHRIGIDAGDDNIHPTAIAVIRSPRLTAAPWQLIHYEEWMMPREKRIARIREVTRGYPGAVAMDPGPVSWNNPLGCDRMPRIVQLTRDLKRTWLFMLAEALADRRLLIAKDPSIDPLIESLRSIELEADAPIDRAAPRSVNGNDHGTIALALAWLLVRRPSIGDRNR